MKLSIIIPVFNSEKYLNKCIESCCKCFQRNENFEIILVDDGSTDNSGSICDFWGHEYDFIKVIHKANGGVSSARNLGIKAAQGKYIAFIDSDDYLEGKDFNNILNTCIENDLDVCFYKFKIMDRNGGFKICFDHAFSYNNIYTGEYVIENNFNTSSACIAFFKLEHIKKHSISFCEDMAYSEDADFVFHAIVFAKKIMFTNYAPYVYAYNGESATNSTNTNIEKRHKKIRSNILMAKHLNEIYHNCDISKNLHPILKRWSNSIVVGEFLSLKKSFEDIAFFCRESNSLKVLPIKGKTQSWKSTIMIPIINTIAFFLQKKN